MKLKYFIVLLSAILLLVILLIAGCIHQLLVKNRYNRIPNNNLELCNDLFCAKIESDKLVQFKTYTIEIIPKVNDLDSITELVNDGDSIIDRIDTTMMICNPSNCNKFPLMIRNEGKHNVSIIVKRRDIEKTINFDVNVNKYPQKNSYINFPDSQLKKFKLLIAINDDYYNKKDPDFIKNKSKELVNYINAIFSKNTKIRFEYIGTLKYYGGTLKDGDDMDTIAKGYNADKVLFIWFNDNFDNPDRPGIFSAGGNTFGNKYFSYVGRESYNIFETPLDSQIQQDYGTILHELGHTFSLGLPEQYFLDYYDCNPNAPQLDAFNYLFEYPFEPMNKGIQGVVKDDYMFSDYSAVQLNNFTNLTWSEIDNIGKNAYVKIVDTKGLPVASANVTMYCLRVTGVFSDTMSCQISDKFNFNKVERDSRYQYTFDDKNPINKLTESDGAVKIPFLDYNRQDLTNGCIAYSIKAKKDDKTAGTYVNIIDSRFEKFMNDRDVYVRILELK